MAPHAFERALTNEPTSVCISGGPLLGIEPAVST